MIFGIINFARIWMKSCGEDRNFATKMKKYLPEKSIHHAFERSKEHLNMSENNSKKKMSSVFANNVQLNILAILTASINKNNFMDKKKIFQSIKWCLKQSLETKSNENPYGTSALVTWLEENNHKESIIP